MARRHRLQFAWGEVMPLPLETPVQMPNISTAIDPTPINSTARATGSYSSHCQKRESIRPIPGSRLKNAGCGHAAWPLAARASCSSAARQLHAVAYVKHNTLARKMEVDMRCFLLAATTFALLAATPSARAAG